jgi:hypothetical protein
MKNYQLIIPAFMIALSACSISNTTSTTNQHADSVTQDVADTTRQVLKAKMQITGSIKVGTPLEMRFTVYNDTDSALQFLKWHTPFEPLVSKYLDIKDENGLEVDYRGAMAKRMMPPPADSYIKIQPGDSLSATVDLLKGYAITKPSKYAVVYSGGNISGLTVSDSVSFVYGR